MIPAAARPFRRQMALVALVAFLVNVRVLSFGFAYDDQWTILQNPGLERPLGDLLRAMARGDGVRQGIVDSTRPWMVAGTWLDHRLWGAWAGGHHAHSLVLHVAASVATLCAAFALTRRRAAALVAALFFSVAPVHAEVIAAINYREDLHAALGVLVPIAWLFWPRASEDRWPHAAAVAAVWLAGLLGKESAFALVPVLVAIVLVRRPGRTWLRSREPTLLALGAVGIVWLNWRLALMLGADDVPRAAGAWWARLLDFGRFEARALVDTLVPVRWSPEWEREGTASWPWLAVPVALVLALSLSTRRRLRPALVGAAVAAIAPIVASPLVSPSNPRADRYLYVAVAGAGIVWGALLAGGVRSRTTSRVRAGLGIAGLGALALLSQPALAVWRTDHDLWLAATTRAPGSARAWAGRSRAERIAGDLDAADRSIERAIAIDPQFVPARVTRAYALLARGDVEAARREIAAVRALGGANQRGVARAERCAELPPPRARDCIRPTGSP